MDNFLFDMTGEGIETFKAAFSLVGAQSKKGVVGYRVCEKKGMILYWARSEDSILLPYEMNMGQAAAFVWGWLQKADYGKEPDIDGDCERGWRIYNELWGHVSGDYHAFLAIKPEWSLYGR